MTRDQAIAAVDDGVKDEIKALFVMLVNNLIDQQPDAKRKFEDGFAQVLLAHTKATDVVDSVLGGPTA